MKPQAPNPGQLYLYTELPIYQSNDIIEMWLITNVTNSHVFFYVTNIGSKFKSSETAEVFLSWFICACEEEQVVDLCSTYTLELLS